MIKKVIDKRDIFLIFISACIALISNIILSLFNGSLLSVIQIIMVSLSIVFAVFIATVVILFIVYLFGWKLDKGLQ